MVKTMNVRNAMVLVIAVIATTSVLILHGAEAAQYTVGDELGWTIPPGGAATYASWAARHSLVVNDVLTFNFAVGENDLALVTKEDFDSCNTAEPSVVFQEPGDYMFLRTGTYYLTCTYAGHCSKGQKIALYFAPASTPSPSPTLSPTPCSSESESAAATQQYTTSVKFMGKTISTKIWGLRN